LTVAVALWRCRFWSSGLSGGALLHQLVASLGLSLLLCIRINQIVGEDSHPDAVLRAQLGGQGSSAETSSICRWRGFDQSFIGENLPAGVAGGGNGDADRSALIDLVSLRMLRWR